MRYIVTLNHDRNTIDAVDNFQVTVDANSQQEAISVAEGDMLGCVAVSAIAAPFKTLLVGRHAPMGMAGIEVVATESVNFPATADGCLEAYGDLVRKAQSVGAERILFQAVPGQLTVALVRRFEESARSAWSEFPVGVIISKVGERGAGKRISLPYRNQEIDDVILQLNPNAKFDKDSEGGWCAIVDPPMKFEFSHIEWF